MKDSYRPSHTGWAFLMRDFSILTLHPTSIPGFEVAPKLIDTYLSPLSLGAFGLAVLDLPQGGLVSFPILTHGADVP